MKPCSLSTYKIAKRLECVALIVTYIEIAKRLKCGALIVIYTYKIAKRLEREAFVLCGDLKIWRLYDVYRLKTGVSNCGKLT